ncbi:polysaccharide deacetylase family sporulation protein PdaB [Pullulanibacillus pueri]|uniref:Polysaccharide deacetylase family sporulation protein PdaB n=1 Tax=Pullulanibacillus pueri TaxID=1437324 RepID=A0A8J2ZY40_9BACL|nr:polysaccharide deacetylase family protein [Pullulanibacillus pueri]MBM7683093.1 polysaccharide deacetylase family sporulation protein PdaB [Pullulanibacillus pueri]GGH85259.1 polysaccharide deacetylase family sporulation protein PdaB [Pullulanibacillus pueri]
MLFIWILNGRKIKNLIFIVVAAFFAALVAFVQNEEITVFSTNDGPRALSKVETNKKQVALTFDIGWGDDRLDPILNYLEKNKIRATFFITGEWAERHKEVVEEMKKKGFEIDSHGYRHEAYTALKSNEITRDIQLAASAIEKASGSKPEFIRPPEGKINSSVLKTASDTGEQVVLWSVNPQDWKNSNYKSIANDVIEQSEKGGIIRLHGSDSATQTYKALPIIINKLKDKHYSFVTLKELVSDSTTKIKNIQ